MLKATQPVMVEEDSDEGGLTPEPMLLTTFPVYRIKTIPDF